MGRDRTPRAASSPGLSRASLPDAGDVIAAKYKIERVLGHGGMGVVYVARHIELGHRVAIKVVRPDIDTGGTRYERFRREAQIAARIPSERVAKVYDFGRLDSGLPFLVMEYLTGADLRAEVRDGGPMAVAAAVDCVIQACEPLLFAHGAGIVHRDLKPENLFLVRGAVGKPVVKVLDFGISKLLATGATGAGLAGLTATSTTIGSPAYMSPEQVSTPSEVDTRADVWGLGAVLFTLLTGRLPFEGEAASAILVAIATSDPSPPSRYRAELPSALERVILDCLEKDPARRPSTVTALAERLAPFASDEGRALAAALQAVSLGKIASLLTEAQPRVGESDGRALGFAATAPIEGLHAAETRTRDGSVEVSVPRAPAVSATQRLLGPREVLPFALGAAAIAVVAALGVFALRRGGPVAPDADASAERAGATSVASITRVVATNDPTPPGVSATAVADAGVPLAASALVATPAAPPRSASPGRRAPTSAASASAKPQPHPTPSANPIDRPELDDRK